MQLNANHHTQKAKASIPAQYICRAPDSQCLFYKSS